MPVLPLIDLMILIAWTSLIVAGAQKMLSLALARNLTILGIGPIDLVVLAGVCLLFALALAARVWVRATEPALARARREAHLRSLQGDAAREVLADAPDPREVAGRV